MQELSFWELSSWPLPPAFHITNLSQCLFQLTRLSGATKDTSSSMDKLSALWWTFNKGTKDIEIILISANPTSPLTENLELKEELSLEPLLLYVNIKTQIISLNWPIIFSLMDLSHTLSLKTHPWRSESLTRNALWPLMTWGMIAFKERPKW